MAKKIIGKGAATSTGGRVLQGNNGIVIDGAVDAASVGHLASCPVCKKAQGPIVAVGSRTVLLPAGLVALAGDYVACGCPANANILIAAQSSVFGGAESAAVVFGAGVSMVSNTQDQAQTGVANDAGADHFTVGNTQNSVASTSHATSHATRTATTTQSTDAAIQQAPQSQEPPQPQAQKCLVKSLSGPKQATVGEQAIYRITEYDFSGEINACKDKVQWRIEIYASPEMTNPVSIIADCRTLPTLFRIQSDRLTIIAIPADWACFIRVYPYVSKPLVAVSQATQIKIQPLLLARADSGKHDDLAVGDYTDNRFKPLFEDVYDLLSPFGNYGPNRVGSPNHIKWRQHSYTAFIKQSDDQLFAMFLDLITAFSMTTLEIVGKEMVGRVKENNGGRYSHPLLNQATLNAASELRLLTQVQEELNDQLAVQAGDITAIGQLKNLEGFVRYIEWPIDYINGLGILINGTAGYTIELTDYQCLSNRRYRGQIKMTIYDHFGLDVMDVTVNNPNEKRIHMTLPPPVPFQFLAWFYLQRVRGYQPLLTTIEHTYTIEGRY